MGTREKELVITFVLTHSNRVSPTRGCLGDQIMASFTEGITVPPRNGRAGDGRGCSLPVDCRR